jgi:hypothetical protein
VTDTHTYEARLPIASCDDHRKRRNCINRISNSKLGNDKKEINHSTEIQSFMKCAVAGMHIQNGKVRRVCTVGSDCNFAVFVLGRYQLWDMRLIVQMPSEDGIRPAQENFFERIDAQCGITWSVESINRSVWPRTSFHGALNYQQRPAADFVLESIFQYSGSRLAGVASGSCG